MKEMITTGREEDAKAGKKDAKLQSCLEDADVKALVGNLDEGLSKVKCDVDHIVEKQMDGTSQPSNLQLLTSSVNRESGRKAYNSLRAIGESFKTSEKMWGNVQKLNIRLKTAKVPIGEEDASVKFEKLLRAFPNLGDAKVKADAAFKPVYLAAGGVGETLMIKDTDETAIEATGVRIVPGMRLQKYFRAAKKAGDDSVTAKLDHRAMEKMIPKKKSAT
jgi:hypothetical protein